MLTYEALDMIEAILTWAESHPKFDTGFVHSVEAWIREDHDVTERQFDALDRIIEGFRIAY